MYKPKLGCRRKVENGGHDVRGLVRYCDTECCRSSPPVDEGAAVRLVVHHHQVLTTVQRSHHRISPRFPRRTRPENPMYKCDLKTKKHDKNAGLLLCLLSI